MNIFQSGENKGNNLLCYPYYVLFCFSAHSGHLMVTAGATQALHMIASILFSKDSVVFMEDPSYFAAGRIFIEDLQMNVVSGKFVKLSTYGAL
jgi:hypothetical protein